jgi:radical SAM/SPASM domain protein of ACGX system
MALRYYILQWHITARCEQRCKHCYMYDEPSYQNEIENPLSLDDCYQVVDQFLDMVDRLSEDWQRYGTVVKPRILFSGGDPLLREDFFEILTYAGRKNISIGILGNPQKVTPESPVKFKELGVNSYQISIDGMEATHDALRTPGSFKDSLRALRLLKDDGIKTIVMFTLSKLNADDLIPVMKLIAREEFSRFAFARISSMGEARKIEETFSPYEYRALLLSVYEEIKRLKGLGAKTKFVYKDPLWNALRYELGEYKLWGNGSPKKLYDGCHAGQSFLVLLADGTIYACRRFTSPIGNVRRDNLYRVFRYSKTLNQLRNLEMFEKCRNCEIRGYCRGCPAVAFNSCGSFLGPDPQCWRDI